MTPEVHPVVVGLPDTTITPDERAVLERVRPQGIILFERNFADLEGSRALVASLQELEPRPFVCVDLEGGMVNRLSGLWGALPSPAQAARSGRSAVRALGEAAGAACRNLGIHLDLAPVVDLERPGGMIGRQERCLSDDPERVATLARVFRDGLSTWGIGACLKHFPGLGAVPVDTHEELPQLEIEDRDLHSRVFADLAEEIPVVMVGHAVAPDLGDGHRPASLSRAVVEHAANLPGSPVVLSDDLEMGALEGFGDLPDLVVAALTARSHGVLVCKAFDRLPEIVDRIGEAVESDPTLGSRIDELASRLGTLSRDLCQNAAAVPAPDDETVAQLWEVARRKAAG